MGGAVLEVPVKRFRTAQEREDDRLFLSYRERKRKDAAEKEIRDKRMEKKYRKWKKKQKQEGVSTRLMRAQSGVGDGEQKTVRKKELAETWGKRFAQIDNKPVTREEIIDWEDFTMRLLVQST